MRLDKQAGFLSMGYNFSMQYIIDGHNLIPHLRGMSLTDPEDEQALIDLLIPFLRAKKSRAMVFFDKAAVGMAGQRNFGLVKAFFVHSSSSADAAIADYVRQLGGAARNHTLVSSDRMVQASARAHHLTILTSQAFAEKLESFWQEEPVQAPREATISEQEIMEWEELFSQYGGTPPDGMSP